MRRTVGYCGTSPDASRCAWLLRAAEVSAAARAKDASRRERKYPGAAEKKKPHGAAEKEKPRGAGLGTDSEVQSFCACMKRSKVPSV
jgi:hypothetical protein